MALTIERLRELLDYNPTTGDLTWKVHKSIRVRAGDKITGRNHSGHLRVGIDCKRYLAHRIAWFHYYEKWPLNRLDHIDHNPSNNRLSNLREATHAQNLWNRGAPRHNTSGFKGVSYVTHCKKWDARITANGKLLLLGLFATPEEAHVAYCAAAKRLHGEFARTE